MRLIDADTLEGRILMDAPGFMDGGSEITKAFILAMIKTRSVTPTIDAVQVVRCDKCTMRDRTKRCHIWGKDVKDDDYCSYGKWKKGELDDHD